MAQNKRKILEAARKHVQKGAKDKALKEYQKLLRSDPKDAKLRLEIGDAYRRWGDLSEAVDTYTKVAEQYTNDGFDARAVAVYKQIQNLVPDRFETHAPLAELYERMGLTAEAIAALQAAADGYHKAGQRREALELLRRMANLDPTNTTSRIKVADLLRQEDLESDALQEYDEIVTELERQGETEAAASVYERILEIQPDRVETLLSFARTLLAGGLAERAEPVAKRAIDADPDVPEHYELLAEIYGAQRREAEIVDVYRRLAEVYRKRGDDEKAREILQRFVPGGSMAIGADSDAGIDDPAIDDRGTDDGEIDDDGEPEEVILEDEILTDEPGSNGELSLDIGADADLPMRAGAPEQDEDLSLEIDADADLPIRAETKPSGPTLDEDELSGPTLDEDDIGGVVAFDVAHISCSGFSFTHLRRPAWSGALSGRCRGRQTGP